MEREASKKEGKREEENELYFTSAFWQKKSKGLTGKVSFILANYAPMSAQTKSKEGRREAE